MTSKLRRSLANSKGFSLVEMLIVVSTMGLLMLLALPRIERALAQRDVSAARHGYANLFLRAKTAAVAARQPATVTVGSDAAYGSVTTSGGGVRYLSDAVQLQALGVTVSASAAAITVQPTGLVTAGLPYTVRFAKGGVVDSVVITGFGRVN